jgi:hypothetical protein
MTDSPRAITNRLAACIYFADMEIQDRPTVLWDMVPVSKQDWYVKEAAKVLKHAATRKDYPAKAPRRQKLGA